MTTKLEQRTVEMTDFEIRQVDDDLPYGMSFSGYAAVFDSPSQPLPFTETIRSGAFAKTLKSRNNVKMLINHDPGRVLASTRSGTMRLAEDSKGLMVDADLPPTTDGRDMSILLARQDISQMSFGFSVPPGGDSWSDDGKVRELRQIRLHEVSIVSFPAYEATSANVRSVDKLADLTKVDADKLSEALTMLETGQELTDDRADIINEVVDKLRVQPVKNQIDLKSKYLDLLNKQ